MRKYRAFTLGEVLITLAIVGVISAVTIPATIQQSSEKQYAALARKAVSTLQNAIDLKKKYVPTRPSSIGDGQSKIFAWLTDGEQYGHDTLKIVNISNDKKIVQTPDGMVFYHWYTEPNDNPSGIAGTVHVDLNGAEGPTNTVAANNSSTLFSQAAQDIRAYDVIRLQINEKGEVIANTCTSTTQSCARAVKYLNSK